VFQRVKAPPGNLSLQPEVIGVTVEVTKPLKPSMQRIAWRFREQAGRNASETADEPSKDAMREPTRPMIEEGCHCGVHASSPRRQEARAIKAPQSRRGRGGRHVCKETNATWEAPAVAARDRQRDAREGQARPRGVTERPVVARKPPITVERRGLSSRTTKQVARDLEIGDEPTNFI
jgi:hypothetical protein